MRAYCRDTRAYGIFHTRTHTERRGGHASFTIHSQISSIDRRSKKQQESKHSKNVTPSCWLGRGKWRQLRGEGVKYAVGGQPISGGAKARVKLRTEHEQGFHQVTTVWRDIEGRLKSGVAAVSHTTANWPRQLERTEQSPHCRIKAQQESRASQREAAQHDDSVYCCTFNEGRQPQ